MDHDEHPVGASPDPADIDKAFRRTLENDRAVRGRTGNGTALILGP
jgi:hypothetical protein